MAETRTGTTAGAVRTDFPELLRATEWPIPWQPVWGEDDGLGARLGDWGVRGLLGALAAAPQGVLEGFVRGAAGLGLRFDRRHTDSARVFLRQAMGELEGPELERRTRQAWVHFLRLTVDSERFFRRVAFEDTPGHFDVRVSDDVRKVLAQGRGCVLVSGHLGNWEAALSISPWLGFHPLYGVARPPKNRYLAQTIQAVRERRGVRILPRKGAMQSAPAVLAAGGTLGLVVDQRASGRALLAPFFGRPARCDRSPAVLLKRCRVPIVVCVCRMGSEPLRYAVEYGDVLWPEEWAGRDAQAITTRVNQILEREILATPEQYVWIHDRYRDTPETLEDGEPARMQRGGAPPGAGEESPPTRGSGGSGG
jgi:KDO2-lipid IV(A) lauroyltransferase